MEQLLLCKLLPSIQRRVNLALRIDVIRVPVQKNQATDLHYKLLSLKVFKNLIKNVNCSAF